VDQYFNYVTLLLPGNGTNGAQNNTFLDSSTNAFSITRNGNTTQGTFSPFSQTGWGNYFDGSGDYLSIADNAALDLGTGDFTIEGWVYFSTAGVDGDGLISKRDDPTFTSGAWRIAWDATNQKINMNCAAETTTRATPVVSLSTWIHFAFVRSGTTLSCYANGTRGDQDASWGHDLNNTYSLLIGANVTGSNLLTGYLSNVRIVKGTAVYSGATYTVPTAPLTAITNTSLLTCQSNRFVDNSTNNFTITRNGDVSVQAFSPFNPTAAYSAAANGGSGSFDGSGDFLTLATNAALDMGTGNFTVEMWVYSTDASVDTQNRRFFATDVNGTSSIQIGHVTTTTGVAQYCDNGSLGTVITGTTNILNQWAHIAVVRSSGTVTLYVNGVSEGTPATDTGNKGSASFTIGKYPGASGHMKGFMGSLRVVKGTAVYTANFTPPTAPLTAISGTSLLLNFTNAGVLDATAKNDLETVGNAQISTAQSKWGGSSIAFDGTGDYLPLQNVLTANFGSGPFTAELWIYFNNASGTQYALSNYQNNSIGWGLGISSGNFAFWATGDTPDISTSTPAATGTWYHLAVSGQSGAIRLFLNGTQIGSTFTGTPSLDSTLPLRVGDGQGAASPLPLNGYIDDLRITKGVARYTANFTAPTAAFPLIGGGALVNIEYLIVAGGGGGFDSGVDLTPGSGYLAPGGGGGAGGYRTSTAFQIVRGFTYAVVVGAGGARNASGNDSSFWGVTSAKGGSGNGSSYGTIPANGASGGSGGGGGSYQQDAGGGGITTGGGGAGNTPSATPVQGYNGGGSTGSGAWPGTLTAGGGGGSGGAGGTPTGGVGTANSITGTSVTYGTGGTGGFTGGSAGTANSGDGGGAGDGSGTIPNAYGKAGGSGIVVIKYSDTLPAAVTTGSPTVSVSGGFRVYIFNSSGTITF
jgi:hypothetical protein